MKFRSLSVENSIKRIKFLVNELKVQWLEFMDLTFTTNRKTVLQLCDAIIQEDIDFEWGCETRVDRVDEELLSIMYKAGCRKITFGVESGSERIRTLSGKKITDQQFIDVFNLCKALKIRTMANFIFGHPTETIEEMNQTIRFAIKLRPFNVLFTRMIPLPDVEVFEIAKKENKISHDVWIKYMKGEVSLPVYTPEGITIQAMDRIYKKAYLKFYLSPSTLIGYLPFLKNIPFLIRTIKVFYPLVFGDVKFK